VAGQRYVVGSEQVVCLTKYVGQGQFTTSYFQGEDFMGNAQIAFVVDTARKRRRILWIGARPDEFQDWVFNRVLAEIKGNVECVCVPFLKWVAGLEKSVSKNGNESRVWSTLTNWASDKLSRRIKPAVSCLSGYYRDKESTDRGRRNHFLYEGRSNLFDIFLRRSGPIVSLIPNGPPDSHVFFFNHSVLENSRLRQLEIHSFRPSNVYRISEAVFSVTDSTLKTYHLSKEDLLECLQQFRRTERHCAAGRMSPSNARRYVKHLKMVIEKEVVSSSRGMLRVERVQDAALAVKAQDLYGEVMPQEPTILRLSRFTESIRDSVVMIHGGPGQGKTTILRYLAWNACKEYLGNPKRSPLPIYVQSTPDILGAIGDVLAKNSGRLFDQRAVHNLLALTRCVIFLDAFDDIDSRTQRCSCGLPELISRYGRISQIIVTSRNSDIPDVIQDRTFVVSAPSDATMYLTCNGVPQHAAKDTIQQLQTLGAKEILSTPLYLWFIAYWLCKNGKDVLPKTPGLLMEKVVEGCLLPEMFKKRRMSEFRLRRSDAPDVAGALEVLGYQMIDEDWKDGLSQEAIEARLTDSFGSDRKRSYPGDLARNIFGAIVYQELLVPFATNRYMFMHCLLTDYFAAKYLLQLGRDVVLGKLDKAGLRFWSWMGPVSTMLEFVGDRESDAWINALIEMDPFFAVECVSHVNRISQETQKRLIDVLLRDGTDENIGWPVQFCSLACIPDVNRDMGIDILRRLRNGDNRKVREYAAEILKKLGVVETRTYGSI